MEYLTDAKSIRAEWQNAGMEYVCAYTEPVCHFV